MRTDTVFRLDNTFDIWKRITAQDETTLAVVVTYVPDRSDVGLVIPSQGNVYLATKDGIALNSAIRNMRDRNGVAIFSIDGDEYDMYVVDSNPQYDALGSIVGWRSVLKRKIPLNFKQRAEIISEVTG